MHFLLILASLLLAKPLQAQPVYLNLLKNEFSAALLSAKCNTCHRNGAPLNAFGKDFFTLVAQTGDLSNSAGWKELRAKDSDGDGIINEEEIVNDTPPGKAN